MQENRIEKDPTINSLLMLGAAMGGQPIDEIVDEMGASSQRQMIARGDFARRRSNHDLIWKALGFTFHNEEKGVRPDPFLQPTTFPTGWQIKRTDHYMHNKVVDQKGRQRAHYMYKPDMWDRDASAYLHVRFSITDDYGKTPDGKIDSKKQRRVVVDNSIPYDDPNRIMTASDWIFRDAETLEGRRRFDECMEEAYQKLRSTWFANNAPLLNEENRAQAKVEAIGIIRKALPDVKQAEIDKIRDEDLLTLLYWD